MHLPRYLEFRVSTLDRLKPVIPRVFGTKFPVFHSQLGHTKGNSRIGHALAVASPAPVFGAVELGRDDAIRRNCVVDPFRLSGTFRSYQSADTANKTVSARPTRSGSYLIEFSLPTSARWAFKCTVSRCFCSVFYFYLYLISFQSSHGAG